MAVVQCERGHYYDNEKYIECPICAGKEGQDESRDSVTVALDRDRVEDYAMQYIRSHSAGQHVLDVPRPQAAQEGMQRPAAWKDGEDEDGKTISIYEKKKIAGKTAGWIVCTEGAQEGMDYRIRAGFNRIGRGHGNDIVIEGDPQISREEHCSIVYEEKKNIFYIVPKAGYLTYLDEELLDQAKQIEEGQILKIGETRFEFVPFCKGDKKWGKSAT